MSNKRLEQLLEDLKVSGLWKKIKVFYPIVGGNTSPDFWLSWRRAQQRKEKIKKIITAK